MNKKILSFILLILVWFLAALSIDNDVILPGPLAVTGRLLSLLTEFSFYQSLVATFIRAHLAFIASLLLGFGLAFVSYRFPMAEAMLSPWIKCLQTIPQISFIILLLFWFSQEKSILLVVILMAFPIAYFNELEGLKAIEQDYRDIIMISHQSWWYNLRKAYLPLTKSSLLATIKAGLPLSLKVTVMSEVLIHTNSGIGRMLSMARANIDMVGVFAWTIALVVLVSCETHFISVCFSKKAS